ncbi:TniQ family protein [Pseudomonas aeruginosa]|uniref:TniQ family protein n=1 Tax=Pseudomonas aeruginosa TaxID=287 RepID=UPI0039AE9E41
MAARQSRRFGTSSLGNLYIPMRGAPAQAHRKVRSITRWRAWLPSQTIRRACPQCLNDPTNQAVLLVWQLPLMLSCPQHGCWLESYWGMPGRYLQWEIADAAPRPADDAIACMDRRTWQALTTGLWSCRVGVSTPACGSGCCAPCLMS